MVDKIKLVAKERDLIGKQVKQLRKDGFIPAVIYGKDRKPLALSVNAHDFALMYRTAGGNTVIDIEIEKADGSTEKKNVLVHEIENDPVKGNIIHADLVQIKMNEKITTKVPLHFTGDSRAVIELSGSLLTTKDEVEVECLPGNLPHEIEVDISPLEDFEAAIHVSDVKAPEGVVILDDPEETIAYVEAPRTEEEMEELEAPVEEPSVAEEGEEEEQEEQTEEEQSE